MALVQRLRRAEVNNLVAELTEHSMVRQPRTLCRVLGAIEEAGPRISLDDYPTAFSLPMLAALRPHVSQVKLARELIEGVDRTADAREVVEAQVRVLQKLGLEVVAEGVERPEQLQALIGFGVDRFQGYLFHRPEPLDGMRPL